ncbi:MAG: histidine kinase [Bacteroidales bacterium]|nr:histidine kinase [Bacteroidales bacterium]
MAIKKLNINSRLLTILIHVIVWASFIFLPVILFGIPDNNPSPYRPLFHLFLLITFFYLNTSVFIPKLLSKRKIFLFITVMLLCIIFIYFIREVFEYFLEVFFGIIEEPVESPRRYGFVFSAFFVFAISTSIKVTKEWYNNEKQKKEMENEKLISELSFLKSQVNPHFLFNTLNSIYSLANKKSDNTPTAIVKLSQLMRYMLYESKEELVNLESEIEYLNNYIELQKLRLFENIKIIFTTTGDIQNKKIEPMLLIPFIENAFKHGITYLKNTEINILIEVRNNKLFLKVENPIDKTNSTSKEENHGIGLQNIKQRLNLLYPDNYLLTIDNSGDKHITELIIELRK